MIRPSKDNVIVVMEPLAGIQKSAGGIHLVESTKPTARASRWGRVVAVGPGHHKLARRKLGGREYTEETGAFIPTTVRFGDRVLLDADAGQDYALDISIPRHNVSEKFEELCGTKGEFRVIREDEIHLYEREESDEIAAE